jgi:glycosyltransferase involved in cell wall biosynthesis
VTGVRKKKLLYVSSNHLAVTPGGLETYTQDLYDSFRDSDDYEPVFLARAGQPFTEDSCYHGWSPFRILEDDPNQWLFYTNTFADLSQYDPLFGRWKGKQVLTRFFADFLEAQQPDIVHVQHTIFMGYELLRVIRNTLGDVPIVYTMHEYVPICFHDGQMVRTMGNKELCREASPRRCHECFPAVSPQTFYMRKRFIQSHLKHVDHFIAPGEYVKERYVDWGLPAEKITVEPQGMVSVRDRLPEEPVSRPRNRFGFFGQLNPYKGADVLLEAMEILGDDFDGELVIHGANLQIQAIEFRERISALLDSGRDNVSVPGAYERSDLNKLMQGIDWVIVPSIWWETGPMVVPEAFQYGRPVICSDIGGMSEKVTDGVNGLHFRRRDPHHLADVMRHAAETPGLWEQLQAGIPREPFRSMRDHVDTLARVYGRLLDERAARNARAKSTMEAASA